MTKLQINTKTLTLNTGAKIPAVGLGTWQATEEGDAYRAVLAALKNDYKHIDAAAIYGNEEEVGKAIKDSGVRREDIFVTTKLWNTDHKNIENALNTSLKKLGLDYIDLYLIHWPVSLDPETGKYLEGWNFIDTYKELQKVYKSSNGKIRAIGISNFTLTKIQKLLADPEVDVIPAVNQIEAHPLLTQPELFDYLKEKGILVTAYSPLGSTGSPLFKNETVMKIADKCKVQPAQVLISWAVQRGTVVIPKSVTASRVIDNLKTFTLEDADFDELNGLVKKEGETRVVNYPLNDFSTWVRVTKESI